MTEKLRARFTTAQDRDSLVENHFAEKYEERLKSLDGMKPIEEKEVLPKLGEEWRSTGSSNANVQEIPGHFDQELKDEITYLRFILMCHRNGITEDSEQIELEHVDVVDFSGKTTITLLLER